MILDILHAPNDVLTTRCEDAVPSAEISLLLHSMIETLQATPNALGLAAPQVGVPVRAFVMGTEQQGYLALLNPRITKRSGISLKGLEGCLSQPGRQVVVKRPASVEVTGIDAEGKSFRMKAKGMAARVICHEVDHLDGKLI